MKSWNIPYPDDFECWELTYHDKHWTTNKDRNLHHHARAKLIKKWRVKFCELAKEANIPELEVMYIEVIPNVATRNFQDTAACNPAAKAAIDGIVDAGVVPDDSKEWLHWILFHPCVHTRGEYSLTIKVIGKILDKDDQ